MAKLGLNAGKFLTVPEGEQVLKITKVVVTPRKNPTKIVIDMEDMKGAKVSERFMISNETSVYYFTLLYWKATGNDDVMEIDTDKLAAELTGKFIKGQIEHTVKDKIKDGVAIEGETVTFANLKKAVGSATGFPNAAQELAVADDLDDMDDEDDDLDDLDDLDDDDEDDLPD